LQGSLERIYGSSYDDNITGNSSNNLLHGGKGDDVITGELGKDTLYGDSGNDIFRFTSLNDSKFNQSDLIKDFTKGEDKIDFSALNFITIVRGEDSGYESILSYHFDGTNTIISDHDHTFAVKLTGNIDLDASDFNF
jgi:Ca2+-binding RTX toxin-like protein